jgi:uncharacterized membrane protein
MSNLPRIGALTIIDGLAFQLAMIRVAKDAASRDAVSVVVLPHRSLSRAGLLGYLLAQGVAALGFAGLAAVRGVVLAPLFAVLELVAVAWCVTWVWRASARGQVVTIAPDGVEIKATAGAPPARYHPYWMKVRLEPGRWPGWPSRLLVGSHGRETEVGAFLNDAERRELAQRLMQLLRDVQSRGRESGHGTR